MCGIYGIAGLRGPVSTEPGWLDRMGDAIVHRGPDDHGTYVDELVRLGMRRLSIIDLSGGHQPIFNEDRSVVVVCNGEIYNYRRLRAELEGRGHRFTTHSDTEVVVHLYEERGLEFLRYLDGMFGLAVWDIRARRLVVARDALGIKPVYYGIRGAELAFASEAKSLLALPGFDRKLSPVAFQQYLSVGYVAGPQSMFEGILKLPPGHALLVADGQTELRRFWSLPSGLDERRTEAEWIRDTRAGIDRAVLAQMVSDVPIGAFLSGGIDSSAVVASMARHSTRPVKTYSIGFQGSSGAALYNELPYARAVSQAFATEHREIVVQPDVVGLLPELLWHMDEPMADAAFITTYLVSRFAREDVTVILSGVGGDELFGGYKRYLDSDLRARYHRLPRFLRRAFVEPLAAMFPSDRHSRALNALRLAKAFIEADRLAPDQRYRRYMEVFDDETRQKMVRGEGAELDDCIRRAFGGIVETDELRRLMEVDLATQLPEDLLALTDRMSMAVSLECRVPLLDQSLVEMAATMPSRYKIRDGELKYVLKRSLEGILPREILYREKRGFGAPIGAWFRAELAPLLRKVLSRECIERRGLLDHDSVSAVIREHESQRSDRTDHLLSLVNFEIWARMYLDGQSPSDVTAELREALSA